MKNKESEKNFNLGQFTIMLAFLGACTPMAFPSAVPYINLILKLFPKVCYSVATALATYVLLNILNNDKEEE